MHIQYISYLPAFLALCFRGLVRIYEFLFAKSRRICFVGGNSLMVMRSSDLKLAVFIWHLIFSRSKFLPVSFAFLVQFFPSFPSFSLLSSE